MGKYKRWRDEEKTTERHKRGRGQAEMLNSAFSEMLRVWEAV